jgi:hypothetical protein
LFVFAVECFMPNVVCVSETTLGIKHSTAKTNKTKTIQRHRRH